MPDSSAGKSLTVAMALSCQIAVRAYRLQYRLRYLWLFRAKSCGGSEGFSCQSCVVAKAFRAKAV